MTRTAGILGAAAALILVGAGCNSTGELRSYDSRPGRYDRLRPDEIAELRLAREDLAQERLDAAWRRLQELSRENPDNLPLSTFRQEVELATLAAGEYLPLPELVLGEHDVDPRVRLARVYRTRAEEEPSAAALVLAARLEIDPETALADLDRALELDPDCVWAHYGRAWNLFLTARFDGARNAIDAAFDVDPGHMPTRRLEAALLLRSGDRELAIRAHEAWLADAAGDPRIAEERRSDVRVDLAALYVLEDDAGAGLNTLDAIAPEFLGRPADAEMIRATAFESLGFLDASLRAAQRAAELSPNDPRPLVQQALLLGERMNDREGEREMWERVLQVLDADPGTTGTPGATAAADPAAAELAELMIRLQAQARLARLAQG